MRPGTIFTFIAVLLWYPAPLQSSVLRHAWQAVTSCCKRRSYCCTEAYKELTERDMTREAADKNYIRSNFPKEFYVRSDNNTRNSDIIDVLVKKLSIECVAPAERAYICVINEYDVDKYPVMPRTARILGGSLAANLHEIQAQLCSAKAGCAYMTNHLKGAPDILLVRKNPDARPVLPNPREVKNAVGGKSENAINFAVVALKKLAGITDSNEARHGLKAVVSRPFASVPTTAITDF